MFSHVDTDFYPGYRPATKQISVSDQIISHKTCDENIKADNILQVSPVIPFTVFT
jgi:hypothetical protein